MQDRIEQLRRGEMNVVLMRRVAEVLMSYEPEQFASIDLDARGRIVILKGRVVGDEARKLAVELARSTVGVDEVFDALTVVARIRPRPVVETLSTPEKQDSAMTRGLVLASLLGIIASAVGLMVKGPSEMDTPVAAVVVEKATVYPVEGTLYVEGKPAAGAQVVFHPVGDFTAAPCRAAGVVGPDGKFSLKTFDDRRGAPAGKFAVTVTWHRPILPGEEISPQECGSLVPPRFQKIHTTPLRINIRPAATNAEETTVVQLPPIHVTQMPHVRRT